MSNDLEPADPQRCQVDIIERAPFALGGTHRTYRCENKPMFVITERKPGADGQHGAMSVCPSCIPHLEKANMHAEDFVWTPIPRRHDEVADSTPATSRSQTRAAAHKGRR